MEEQQFYEKEHDLLDREMQEQLESKVRRRNRMIVLTCVLIGSVILLGIIFVCLKLFFTVEEIRITGSERYTSEELSAILPVKNGDILPFVSENDIRKALEKNFIFVSGVQVDKQYPDSIEIRITDETPLYFFETKTGQSTSCVVVSESGKVLAMLDSLEKVTEEYPTAVPVLISDVKYAVIGKKLQLMDSRSEGYVNTVLENLKGTVFEDMPLVINLKSRFDMRIYCGVNPDGSLKYEILLGNQNNLKIKLEFAQSIMKELSDSFTGVICVEDPKNGYADPK